MSYSRLEKFIYAICSMDVTDLPAPLSRIEILWNCLITGETPDFEPLSRNEKYLMAMLDRYDISNLPAPMSRGEKLLYKIAVGETDLSDVPGYLSRYEELLKYLIENGGISGGDFEYVLYTLNQSLYTLYTTAEKPVKSAILKGQTLVNLAGEDKKRNTIADGKDIRNLAEFSGSKEYTFCFNVEKINDSGVIRLQYFNGLTFISGENKNIAVGANAIAFTTPANATDVRVQNANGVTELIIDDVMIIEGDYTNVDIPYFTGMQSVKMPVLTTTGKNLFDKEKHKLNPNFGAPETYYGTDYIKVKPLTTYTRNNQTSLTFYANYGDTTLLLSTTSTTFTTTAETNYIRYNVLKTEIDTHQLEEGSTATTYEPYKSNILTVNEEVTLRGIGEVGDTLDLMTGEVVERIGEVIFDGSVDENWELWVTYPEESALFRLSKENSLKLMKEFDKNGVIKCDKFSTVLKSSLINDGVKNPHAISFFGSVKEYIQLRVYKSLLKSIDVTGLREYLTNEPITVQYQLTTESVKTVDLTVVDQDNQPTELGTFENMTHVSLEAENLIPEVEMEVATNLLEDTVFNLTNAFNTLYPTAAKPVKSAILKGQTLVNLHKLENYSSFGVLLDEGWKQHFGRNDSHATWRMLDISMLKPNTDYGVFCWVSENTLSETYWECHAYHSSDTVFNAISGLRFNAGETGMRFGKLTTISDFTGKTCGLRHLVIKNTPSTEYVKFRCVLVEYQKGMENWDIPYFEGMQSVKMPVLKTVGKNLFDGKLEYGIISGTNGRPYDSNDYVRTQDFIPINYEKITYTVINEQCGLSFYFYDKDKNFISSATMMNVNGNLSTPEGVAYLKFRTYPLSNESVTTNLNTKIQIEEGSVATEYESFKSNILSASEDVELRGIDEVRDELNLLTGELTQSLVERVFDGTENWIIGGTGDNYKLFRCESYTDMVKSSNIIVSDKYAYSTTNNASSNLNITYSTTTGKLCIVTSQVDLSLDDFKSKLSVDKPRVQYQLAEKVIKTVDLTVVNQDGNETKLRTFDDTTHVLLHSEAGPNPGAVLTVRTKIPSASSTSLLMDDISTEQQQLETTVDEQSNNVDATMIATTEIYEETL